MKKQGFTLVELMVVILIVGILAAVAIPLMHGRIDAAKWSEAKAAMGTIATGLRAYYAEKQGWGTISDLNEIGISTGDLDGSYFDYDCYAFTTNGTTTAGGPQFSVTASADESGKTDKPTSPSSVTMTVNDDGTVTWTETE